MRGLGTNLLDWQKRYETEEACAKAADAATLAGDGFRCPRYGHDHDYVFSARHTT